MARCASRTSPEFLCCRGRAATSAASAPRSICELAGSHTRDEPTAGLYDPRQMDLLGLRSTGTALFGRERERAEIDRLIECAAEGESQALVVRGKAGIGTA